ncbi:hypothetical protein Hsc_4546 [Herbaspirillum seropedicae]|nr:hypothetical protein Hsc_4546 [Herbaspirillum seropedicae]
MAGSRQGRRAVRATHYVFQGYRQPLGAQSGNHRSSRRHRYHPLSSSPRLTLFASRRRSATRRVRLPKPETAGKSMHPSYPRRPLGGQPGRTSR